MDHRPAWGVERDEITNGSHAVCGSYRDAARVPWCSPWGGRRDAAPYLPVQRRVICPLRERQAHFDVGGGWTRMTPSPRPPQPPANVSRVTSSRWRPVSGQRDAAGRQTGRPSRRRTGWPTQLGRDEHSGAHRTSRHVRDAEDPLPSSIPSTSDRLTVVPTRCQQNLHTKELDMWPIVNIPPGDATP